MASKNKLRTQIAELIGVPASEVNDFIDVADSTRGYAPDLLVQKLQTFLAPMSVDQRHDWFYGNNPQGLLTDLTRVRLSPTKPQPIAPKEREYDRSIASAMIHSTKSSDVLFENREQKPLFDLYPQAQDSGKMGRIKALLEEHYPHGSVLDKSGAIVGNQLSLALAFLDYKAGVPDKMPLVIRYFNTLKVGAGHETGRLLAIATLKDVHKTMCDVLGITPRTISTLAAGQ